MPGGAAVAVVAGHDAPVNKRGRIEVPDVSRAGLIRRHGQGVVEITIVQCAVPTHMDLAATHQPAQGCGIERLAQMMQIPLVLAAALEVAQKPADGHVRDGVQIRESDPEPLFEFPAVVPLQPALFGRRGGMVYDCDQSFRASMKNY